MKRVLFALICFFVVSISGADIIEVPEARMNMMIVGGQEPAAGGCSGDIGSEITADTYSAAGGNVYGVQITANCTGNINSLTKPQV